MTGLGGLVVYGVGKIAIVAVRRDIWPMWARLTVLKRMM